MVFIRLGGEKVEGFYFHNNWKVQVDYGMNRQKYHFQIIMKLMNHHYLLKMYFIVEEVDLVIILEY